MSPLARLRLAAVLLGLLALASHFGLRKLAEANPTASPWWIYGGAVAVLVVLAGGYAVLRWPYRREPATFDIEPRGFAAQASPANGFGLIVAGWAIGGYAELIPAIVLVAVAALSLLPKVTLTETHLLVRGLWPRRIRWDRIAPDRTTAYPNAVEMEIMAAFGRWRTVSVYCQNTRHVDSAFLAKAIWRYAAHPEHRAAIGTEAELASLKTLSAAEKPAAETPWPDWIPG